MICKSCKSPLPGHLRNCQVCQVDNGFPNVRMAQSSEEQSALEKRHEDAIVSVKARNCIDILETFEKDMSSSNAVICSNLGVVWNLVSTDNKLYIPFQKQIYSGGRLPEDSQWDFARPIVEQTVFPYFSDEIIYAALSINDKGLVNYGEYHIILKEEFIKERASLFNENTVLFCKKHKVVVGDYIPPGFRSTWDNRAILAGAKLHSKLDKTSNRSDFPQILLNSGANSEDDDFIEVHIFGSIHRRTIEKVIGPKPRRQERSIMLSVERKLKEVGATFEVLE